MLGDSDALGDNRPSILSLGAGHLLIAQAIDHRLSPLTSVPPPFFDGVNSDIYALEVAAGALNAAQAPN